MYNKPIFLKCLKQAFLLILLFFYVFPVSFKYLPFSTHVILSILGICYWFLLSISYKSFSLSKETMTIVKIVFILSFFALLSYFLNNNSESKFVFYFFPLAVNFYAAYFICKMYINCGIEINENKICFDILMVSVLQIVITLLMAVNPAIMGFILNVQKESSLSLDIVEETMSFRLLGFGSMFFYSGIVNSIALIIVVYLYIINYANRFFLLFIYLVLFCVGMIMARTTLVGGGVSLLLLFIYSFSRKTERRLLFGFFKKFLLILFFCAIFIVFFVDFSDVEQYYKFGFEMFDNYFNNEGFTSASTDQLSDLYIYPKEIKTYLYGDSRWTDFHDPSLYYMHTDVGYLRLIFYFGLSGTMIFLIYILNLTHLLLKNNTRALFSLYVSFAFALFILNLKGFADISNLLFLFYFARKNALFPYSD